MSNTVTLMISSLLSQQFLSGFRLEIFRQGQDLHVVGRILCVAGKSLENEFHLGLEGEERFFRREASS